MTNGFLAMENSNPMMRFAQEIYEGLNQPPSFAVNINAPNENNIADMEQHTFATMNATVYNKTENRMVRYCFGVGFHSFGISHNRGGFSAMVARKECTYEDLHKAFAYITKFQYRRNNSWRMFTTNCNNFVRELAELLGMHDIASLMRSVSCVQTYRNMVKAATEQVGTDKYKGIQFYSEENLLKSNLAMTKFDQSDSHARYYSSIRTLQNFNTQMKLPKILEEFNSLLNDVHTNICGYKTRQDFSTDYDDYLLDKGRLKYLFKRKRFERVILVESLVGPIRSARMAAKTWLSKADDHLSQIRNAELKQGQVNDQMDDDYRRERGMAYQFALRMVADGVDQSFAALPADRASQPYRHFLLRCKGAIRGAESASTAVEKAAIADNKFEEMNSVYAEAQREMSDYHDMNQQLFSGQGAVPPNDNSMRSYVGSMTKEGPAFSNLGYGFIRSMTNASSLFYTAIQKVTEGNGEKSITIKDAVSPLSNVRLFLLEIDPDNLNEHSPVYVFLHKLAMVDSPMTKDPARFAWTLVHAMLDCMSSLWSRGVKRSEANRQPVNSGERLQSMLDIIREEHFKQGMDADNRAPNNMYAMRAGRGTAFENKFTKADADGENPNKSINEAVNRVNEIQRLLTAILRRILENVRHADINQMQQPPQEHPVEEQRNQDPQP